MLDWNEAKLMCIDMKKAEEKHERYWCSEYDEGFDFIDEYCEDCTEYQKLISRMLPKIKNALKEIGEL